MSTTAEHGAPALAPAASRILVATRRHWALSRWYYLTALAAAPAVFITLPHPNTAARDIAQLERLAPKIERAQALSPAAREAIGRLVARQSALVGSSDPSQDMRRTAAIERITGAMKAKEASTVAQGGDRRLQP